MTTTVDQVADRVHRSSTSVPEVAEQRDGCAADVHAQPLPEHAAPVGAR